MRYLIRVALWLSLASGALHADESAAPEAARVWASRLKAARLVDHWPAERAVEALVAIGPRAVPAVLPLLDGAQYERAAIVLARVGALGPLVDLVRANRGDSALRCKAVELIGEHGRADPRSLGVLIHAMTHKVDHSSIVQRAAVEALGGLGAPAIPGLLGALAHPDYGVRARASSRLGELGAAVGARGIGPLVKALGDPDPTVQREAARALPRVTPRTESVRVARHLIRQVESRTADIEGRLAACEALGQLPEGMSAWLPRFLEIANGRVPGMSLGIRAEAAEALARLGRTDDAVRVLLAVPVAPCAWPELEAVCLAALGRLGQPHPAALARLRAGLVNAAPHIRVLAADGLLRLGQPLSAVETPLVAALRPDADRRARRSALDLLSRTELPLSPALERSVATLLGHAETVIGAAAVLLRADRQRARAIDAALEALEAPRANHGDLAWLLARHAAADPRVPAALIAVSRRGHAPTLRVEAGLRGTPLAKVVRQAMLAK